MKCKYCGAELKNNEALCEYCNLYNKEALEKQEEIKEEQLDISNNKKTPIKKNSSILSIVSILCSLPPYVLYFISLGKIEGATFFSHLLIVLILYYVTGGIIINIIAIVCAILASRKDSSNKLATLATILSMIPFVAFVLSLIIGTIFS